MTELSWVTQSQVQEFGLIKTATVTLTDDQIKALPTTPVEIVPAYGSGKMILPLGAVAVINTMGGAYSNVDPSPDAILQIGNNGFSGQSLLSFGDLSNILLGESVNVIPMGLGSLQANADWFSNASTATLAQCDNTPLTILAWNTGDYADGNAANTIKVIVYYTVVDVS